MDIYYLRPSILILQSRCEVGNYRNELEKRLILARKLQGAQYFILLFLCVCVFKPELSLSLQDDSRMTKDDSTMTQDDSRMTRDDSG